MDVEHVPAQTGATHHGSSSWNHGAITGNVGGNNNSIIGFHIGVAHSRLQYDSANLDELLKELQNFLSKRDTQSVLTTHEDDDKQVWRQFRRELRDSGFRSSHISKYSAELKAHLAYLSGSSTSPPASVIAEYTGDSRSAPVARDSSEQGVSDDSPRASSNRIQGRTRVRRPGVRERTVSAWMDGLDRAMDQIDEDDEGEHTSGPTLKRNPLPAGHHRQESRRQRRPMETVTPSFPTSSRSSRRSESTSGWSHSATIASRPESPVSESGLSDVAEEPEYYNGSHRLPRNETNHRAQRANRKGWLRCYGCRQLVEPLNGFNHTEGHNLMICRCTAQFCKACLAPWKTCGCALFTIELDNDGYPGYEHRSREQPTYDHIPTEQNHDPSFYQSPPWSPPQPPHGHQAPQPNYYQTPPYGFYPTQSPHPYGYPSPPPTFDRHSAPPPQPFDPYPPPPSEQSQNYPPPPPLNGHYPNCTRKNIQVRHCDCYISTPLSDPPPPLKEHQPWCSTKLCGADDCTCNLSAIRAHAAWCQNTKNPFSICNCSYRGLRDRLTWEKLHPSELHPLKEIPKLPEGWDWRIDEQNRLFYVDTYAHGIEQRCFWEPPREEVEVREAPGWNRVCTLFGRVYWEDRENQEIISYTYPGDNHITPNCQIACLISSDVWNNGISDEAVAVRGELWWGALGVKEQNLRLSRHRVADDRLLEEIDLTETVNIDVTPVAGNEDVHISREETRWLDPQWRDSSQRNGQPNGTPPISEQRQATQNHLNCSTNPQPQQSTNYQRPSVEDAPDDDNTENWTFARSGDVSESDHGSDRAMSQENQHPINYRSPYVEEFSEDEMSIDEASPN